MVANYLDCKVIYISIVEALAIVRNYADDRLKAILKERGASVASDKNIKERVENTELVHMLLRDSKMKGRKGKWDLKVRRLFKSF